MKLLKSQCEKIWLFDVTRKDGELLAGLACFLPGCEDDARVEIKGKIYSITLPHKAIESVVPVKVSNARLSLLAIAPYE